MDRTHLLPIATRRTTTRTIAALCGIAAITAATWLAWTSPGGMRVSLPTVAAAELDQGRRLFDHETFGGNGRTCRTCHSGDDGTIDPAEVIARLSQNPSDPLFSHDGLKESCILHPGLWPSASSSSGSTQSVVKDATL